MSDSPEVIYAKLPAECQDERSACYIALAMIQRLDGVKSRLSTFPSNAQSTISRQVGRCCRLLDELVSLKKLQKYEPKSYLACLKSQVNIFRNDLSLLDKLDAFFSQKKRDQKKESQLLREFADYFSKMATEKSLTAMLDGQSVVRVEATELTPLIPKGVV